MNPTPSLLQSRAPRRGQALILAVLVMLFAVLLSSAFLVVIGNNGRQIGRENDRSEASRNAEKGVAFVVAQLRTSQNPDAYNPAQFAGTLPSNTTEREIYYSQLDKAMGWEAQNYVKFPNPLTSRQAPQFLVLSNLVTDDAEGGDKRFMRKITVIGLSSKNPETWSRRILYKTTNWNGATFSYANFVTSFDPDTQKPIVSALSAQVSAAPALNSDLSLSIFASKGQGNERVTYSPKIAEVGNTLMISDGQNQPIVGVVKSSTLASPLYTVTIRVLQAGTGAGNFAPNSKVALVGSLFELPEKIDADGSAMMIQDTQKQDIYGVRADVANTNVRPFGNGAQFNNGLNVPVTTTFGARVPEQRTYPGGTTFAGQNALSSSGPISIGDPAPTTVGTPIGVNFVVAVATGTPQPTPTFIPQPNANLNQFLRVSFDNAGATQVETANSLVAPVIVPRTVRPAPLDLAFYRTHAGLYIPNADDVEKFNGQPLSTNQLQRLWQRKSFPVGTGGNVNYTGTNASIAGGTNTAYARLCFARPGTTGDSYLYPMAGGSLEQRGIRGWISPWEFLPRGAQIILNGTTATIYRDPISDNSSNAPDTNKAPVAGSRSFSETLPASFNGIIAAAGNVRISGNWTGAPLTIVSGNNIYIEGNLSTRDTTTGALLPAVQIALLAKKNVVLNPTQFVARPVGTVDTSVGKSAFPGTEQSGAVQLASGIDSFKLGDKVAVFAANVKADGWHEVTTINGTTLTLTPALGSDFSAKAVKVKLACDPPIVLTQVATDSTSEYFEGKTTAVGQPDNDATIIELPVTSANLTQPNTFWSYAFKTGGDTLARNVPFNAPIGVAMRESVAKRNLVFAVQGGEDLSDPDPANHINDDGNRNLESRTSTTNPFELRLTPKSGTATNPPPNPNYDLFDLKQLNDTSGSANPDDMSSILASLTPATSSLKKQLEDLSLSPPADDKTNRWRLVLPMPVSPATIGIEDVVAARRLSQTSVTVALGQNPDGMADPITGVVNPINDETTPTQIRVPLTASVVLFSGALATTSPDTTAISLIGSTFGYQQLVVDPAKETRFIKATALAKDPVWDQPTASGMANVVKYTQSATTSDVGWTRDGAGDYEDQLPAYYLSAMHFQKVDAAMQSVPATGTTPSTSKNNMAVEVDATIYAEGGSWFVIPVPTPNANGAQPADPDQLVEWRRPAYQVLINGNIAQMMTPTVTVDYDDEPDPDGVAVGAMKRWTDSLSYQVTDGTTIRWQTLRYQAAPLPAFMTDAMGNVVLDANGKPVGASLPQLPASTDILYTYSN